MKEITKNDNHKPNVDIKLKVIEFIVLNETKATIDGLYKILIQDNFNSGITLINKNYKNKTILEAQKDLKDLYTKIYKDEITKEQILIEIKSIIKNLK